MRYLPENGREDWKTAADGGRPGSIIEIKWPRKSLTNPDSLKPLGIPKLRSKPTRQSTTRRDNWGQIKETFPSLDPDSLTRNVPGIPDTPSRYQVLGFFKKESVTDLLNWCELIETDVAHDQWTGTYKVIRNLNEEKKRGGLRSVWTPTRRFIVGMLLSKLSDPMCLLDNNTFKNIRAKKGSASNSLQYFRHEIRKIDFISRHSIIHEKMDPLSQLSLHLGINKFLTTNYDLEIERMLDDRGYEISRHSVSPQEVGDQQPRIDALGGRVTDTTFQRDHTADLLSFTLNLEGNDGSVFHLHGLATADSDIVLTERDYMNLYLKSDDRRDMVNEAIDLAFSANPVLFLGIGMTEDDVMRPLRQFVSDQEKRKDRVAIALLPGSKSEDQMRAEASTLFTRFGVLPIYYGDAYCELEKSNAGEGPASLEAVATGTKISWLHLFSNIVSTLAEVNNAQLKALRRIEPEMNRRNEKDKKYSATKALREACSMYCEWSLLKQTCFTRISPKMRASLLNDWVAEQSLNSLAGLNDKQLKPFGTGQKFFGERGIVEIFFKSYGDPVLRFEQQTGKATPDEKLNVEFELALLKNFETIIRNRGSAMNLKTSTAKPFIPKDENPTQFIKDMKTNYKNLFSPDKRKSQIEALIRDCIAVQAGLDGIKQSIYSIFLSANLRHLDARWRRWWNDWQEKPKERVPAFDILRDDQKNEETYGIEPFRYVRHHIENLYTILSNKVPDQKSILELEQKAHDKNEEAAYTGVRAVDTFLASLDSTLVGKPLKAHKGRRTFFIAAHRGLGKGVFMSAMQSRAGLHTFIEKSWYPAQKPHYVSAIFINYSFSTETSSTWDMVNQAIIETIARIESGEEVGEKFDAQITEIGKQVKNLSRLQTLKELLEYWKKYGRKNKKRILVCLSPVDALLGNGGQSKNDQIRRTFDLINSSQFAGLPIDFIMVCEENNLPDFLRKGERAPVFEFLLRPGIEAFGLAQMVRRLKDTKLMARSTYRSGGKLIGENAKIEPTPGLYLHICRIMQQEQFMADNFPVLASHLLVAQEQNTLSKNQARKALVSSHKFMKGERVDNFNPNSEEFSRSCDIDHHKQQIVDSFGEKFIPRISGPNSAFDEAKTSGIYNKAFQKLILQHYGKNKSTFEVKLKKDKDAHNDWVRLRSALQYNRFSFTILLAATEFLTRFCVDVDDAKREADRFMNSVIDQVNAASDERREEIIVSNVLDLYERFHRSGIAMRDINLHLAVIRHLAVIGQPTSCDVLIRVPEIRRWFDRHSAIRTHDLASDKSLDRRTLELRQVMNYLERCGLVFKLSPHPRIKKLYQKGDEIKDGDHREVLQDDPKNQHRYALHRLVQRHVMRKMGGSLTEFIHANDYAATLYGSMPRDLPRPSTEAYRFMRELVADLSEYADRHALSTNGEPWHFGTAEMPTRIQALRAALGILRSTFSVAVVSRFEEYKVDGIAGIQHAGCFEEHRIQLRWLLRKAFSLDKEQDNNRGPEEPPRHIKPFYIDEIIWLYNECGVVCLVQGNLTDAHNFLRQAMHLNRDIEGRGDGGDQHCRIGINLAVVQIERGKLESAASRLDSIIVNSEDGGAVRALAYGYRGLVSHLRGQFRRAEKQYNRALKRLHSLEDSRGISIFSRHLGDLFRHTAESEKATLYHAEALAAAERGGHEDLYHKARLARIRAQIKNADVVARGFTGDLHQIERYAEVMDMPTLLCEALHVRAALLLDQGETGLAGKLLKDVIAKSKRNQMNLRLATAITLYGKAMFQRKQDETGRRLLRASLDMVKQFGFQLEIDRVEEALIEQR